MLSRDSQQYIRSRIPALVGGQAHQFSHSLNVQIDERIEADDALLQIGVQESRCIVA